MNFPGIFGICPVCKIEWRYTAPIYYDDNCQRVEVPIIKEFSKCIALYDRDRDMTVAHKCPKCCSQWDRFTNKLTYKGKEDGFNS